MSDNPVTARLFGKMPTHGDFVSRGLSLAEKSRLDAWLSQEMDLARERCGDLFEGRYDQAPPWCFAGPDQDGRWAGGALCPSIDSAGRRFPLFVACCGVAADQAASAAEYCVDAIFRAFDDRLSADGLCLDIAGAEPASAEAPAGQGWWADGDDRSPGMTLNGIYPDGLIMTMLEGVDL
jgi:type VI secretion system protein ImpM